MTAGSVYKRSSDGLWVGSLSMGKDLNGKRLRKVVYAAKASEAWNKLEDYRASVRAGVTDPTKDTVSQYLNRWLQDSVRLQNKARTLESYTYILNQYVIPAFGQVLVSKLSPEHVQGLMSRMETDGKSPRLRQLVHAVLRRAFNQAVRARTLVFNPVSAVNPPKVPKKIMTVWTQDQVRAFLSAVETHAPRYLALFTLEAETGLRMGELTELRRSDVNLAARTLTVRLETTKTAAGARTLTLTAPMVSVLVRHLELLMTEGLAGSEFLFPSRAGTQILHGNLRDKFKALSEKAGLPEIRFHDLRHTNAALLVESGCDMKTVQGRLGHSRYSTTADTYAKFTQVMDQNAARTMEGIMYG